jgi:hypothetical protein
MPEIFLPEWRLAPRCWPAVMQIRLSRSRMFRFRAARRPSLLLGLGELGRVSPEALARCGRAVPRDSDDWMGQPSLNRLPPCRAPVHGHPWPSCEPAADIKYPIDALARANVASPCSRAARELECLLSPVSVSHTRQHTGVPPGWCPLHPSP